MLVTMPGISDDVIWWCDRVREGTDLFFTVEYVLRIWMAPEYLYGSRVRSGMARRRYLKSFLGVVDLLVILPFWVNQLDIDRKSVVEGKSVSVRVDLGGSRIIKKKKNNETRKQ